MTKYNQEIEGQMLLHFSQLNEKDKRLYSGTEALKLGYGGQKYISELFSISDNRVRSGMRELLNPELLDEIPEGKMRRKGGGRKKKELSHPELIEGLSALIDRHKAGSPTNPDIYWIHFRPVEIAEMFFIETHQKVSNGLVKRVLREKGFKYRKLSKNLATGQYAERDAQFRIIFNLVAIMSLDSPVISIDSKKKEQLGNLYRDGKLYSTAPVPVFDHDYRHLAEGVVIPHGIFDMLYNEGYISIGNSHETAPFIADNLIWWWDNFGIHRYPNARNILILCDAGGGNSYRHHAFKKAMLELAKEIGINIIICHYPPYSSKWNPIEHRLFSHVQRAMQGVVFTDYDIVKELIAKTKTTTGLKVFVRLNLKDYPIGIKTDKSQVDFSRIQFNDKIPNLSYRIIA